MRDATTLEIEFADCIRWAVEEWGVSVGLVQHREAATAIR